jgi:dolichol kinase
MDSALDNKEISYKQEVIRKCIHLVSLSIPIGYFLLDKTVTLFILIPITAIFVI